jgi:protein-arginine kinase activator protein McsA
MNANKPNGCQACHSREYHLLAVKWPWGETSWLCARCYRTFQPMLDEMRVTGGSVHCDLVRCPADAAEHLFAPECLGIET